MGRLCFEHAHRECSERKGKRAGHWVVGRWPNARIYDFRQRKAAPAPTGNIIILIVYWPHVCDHDNLVVIPKRLSTGTAVSKDARTVIVIKPRVEIKEHYFIAL